MPALWPNGSIKEPRISSGYGPRTGIAGARPFHYGVDIPLAADQIIQAAMDGVIIFSDSNGTLGEQTVVDCGRYQFLYPHNRRGSLPRLGQKVHMGEGIARCGLTGLTTGYHTCFRVYEGDWRRDADARDPRQVMAQLNGAATAAVDRIELGIFRELGDEALKYLIHDETGHVFGIEPGRITHFTTIESAQYNANFFTAEDKIERVNTNQFQSLLDGCDIDWSQPDRLANEDRGGTWSFDAENLVLNRRIAAKLGA